MSKILKLGIYISRILKKVAENVSISSDAKETLNMMLQNVVERTSLTIKDINQSANRKTVGSREVQTAVCVLLSGKLAMHAVSEATRAVGKFSGMIDDGESTVTKGKKVSKSSRSGLVMPVTRIGNFMKSACKTHRQSETAPIYMAAVVEYLTEVILTSSVTAPADQKTITPSHIFSTVSNDGDLEQLFTDIMISNDIDILPSEPLKVEPKIVKRSKEDIKKAKGQELLKENKRKSQMTNGDISKIFKKGGHLRLSKDVYDYTRAVITHIVYPFLNNIVTFTEHDNKKTVSLKHVEFGVKYTKGLKMRDDDETFDRNPEQSTSPASTSTSSSTRITKPLIRVAPFQRLLRSMSESLRPDLRFSKESLKLIQSVIEDFLIDLAQESNSVAAERKTVTSEDIAEALQLKGLKVRTGGGWRGDQLG